MSDRTKSNFRPGLIRLCIHASAFPLEEYSTDQETNQSHNTPTAHSDIMDIMGELQNFHIGPIKSCFRFQIMQ